MLKPMLSNLVRIESVGRGEFRAIANEPIFAGSVIEVCPVLALPSKSAILIGKSIPQIEQKFIIDSALIEREYKLFAELGELELENRLNSGQISSDEYRQIMASKVDFNALLNLRSHLIPLGYGMLYRVSDFPNLIREYHSEPKLCIFKAVRYIEVGSELTYSV
jgi:hypothetical protein